MKTRLSRQKRYELEVASKLDNLPIIGDFIAENLAKISTSPATVFHIQLAVDEASTNIIKYAYEGKEGRLKLVMEINGNELIITLIDWGKSFDPNTIPAPDLNATLEERRIGGLGMYFIRKLMDEVSYSFDTKSGNRLVMKKKLS
jgi:serine/threonine-protein kinase RsbW